MEKEKAEHRVRVLEKFYYYYYYFNIVLMWKIMGASKALVIYIYIYILEMVILLLKMGIIWLSIATLIMYKTI